ncbi:MAG TPA: polysaccharide deacetylase family protein [Steroidobacteraceae bacterium]
MIGFNLSMDFEMGWGDLRRLAADDVFHRRVVAGLEQSGKVLEVLRAAGIPTTWGIVGGCCHRSLQTLQQAAPEAYALVEAQLDELVKRRRDYASVLFCPETVVDISREPGIEVGSHGFLHLVPNAVPARVLRSDVAASVEALRATCGVTVASFIPPQNYDWPDAAFADTGIRYVRHTPMLFGHPYSSPAVGAKFARLWNDLIVPVEHRNGADRSARMFFLRLDRGAALWNGQLRMLRELIAVGQGCVFCYSHPHNLDTPVAIARFAQLCDVVATAKERDQLDFRRFFRELH